MEKNSLDNYDHKTVLTMNALTLLRGINSHVLATTSGQMKIVLCQLALHKWRLSL